MAFKGVTCAGQNVTPKNDRGLIRSHFGDGILWGCDMSVSGDDLVVALGEIVAGGTIVFVDGSTNVDLSGRQIDTGYIQVILNVDLTKPEGEQIYTTYEESASVSGFSALTKDDIWATGTLYQFELAVVQISGGNLVDVYRSPAHSGVITYNNGSTYNVSLRLLDDDTFRVGRMVGGNSDIGMSSNSTDDMYLFANEHRIFVRPNGIGSSAGQSTFRTDGSVGYSNIAGTPLETAISGSIKCTVSYNKRGNVVTGTFSAGTGSALSNFTSGVNLGTLDSGLRPEYTIYAVGQARTSGAWASATYYPIILSITPAGTVTLLGNQTNIRSCQYIVGAFCFGTS